VTALSKSFSLVLNSQAYRIAELPTGKEKIRQKGAMNFVLPA
jgi:hypothetical protein